jgi:hypothetical protein
MSTSIGDLASKGALPVFMGILQSFCDLNRNFQSHTIYIGKNYVTELDFPSGDFYSASRKERETVVNNFSCPNMKNYTHNWGSAIFGMGDDRWCS